MQGQDSPAFTEASADALSHSWKKAGKELKEEYIFPGAWEFGDGVKAYERFKQLEEKPTAIFAMNDLMATGFMDAALNDGVRIPEDVSVIGFDNRQECRFTRPRLTTIVICPLERMENAAVLQSS